MSKLIKIALLDPSPWADLFDHPEEHIRALAEDIKERGIQTPIQVWPIPNTPRFEMLTGHDRVEASKRIGLTEVPVETRSTLSEDERFRHFIADNCQRKGVDSRRLARAVLIREKGNITNREVARLVRCDDHTVQSVREQALAVAEIPQQEKRSGSDGKQYAASKPPRTPALPKPVSKLDQLRAQREAAAEQTEQERVSFIDEPSGNGNAPEREVVVAAPVGVDIGAEIKQVRAEYKASPFGKLSQFLCDLPVPPRMSDDEFAAALPECYDAQVKQARTIARFLYRFLSHFPEQEAKSA